MQRREAAAPEELGWNESNNRKLSAMRAQTGRDHQRAAAIAARARKHPQHAAIPVNAPPSALLHENR